MVDASSLKIEGVLVLKKSRGDSLVEVQKLTDHGARPGPDVGRRGGRGARRAVPAVDHRQRGARRRRRGHRGSPGNCHHRKELAEELTDAIDPGHSGLVLLVSDHAAVELQQALAKADHIVQKAVDKAAAEEIKAEANTARATAKDSAKS